MTSRLGSILGFALVAAAGTAHAADQADPNAPPPPPNAQPGAPNVQVQVYPDQNGPQPGYGQPQPVYVGQPAPVYGGPPPGAYGGPPPQGGGYGPGPGGPGPGYGNQFPYLRTGISVNGGAVFGGGSSGDVVSLGLRIGVQFNPWIGLYYQNTPSFFFNNNYSSVLDYNTLLLSLILFDHLELAGGVSYDYYDFGTCASSSLGNCNGWALGAHGRVAVLFSWWRPWFRRRHGVSIGVDVHPIFVASGDTSISATLGIGFDWY